jgi:uncharacterized coiled-coil protein SlyX
MFWSKNDKIKELEAKIAKQNNIIAKLKKQIKSLESNGKVEPEMLQRKDKGIDKFRLQEVLVSEPDDFASAADAIAYIHSHSAGYFHHDTPSSSDSSSTFD